MNNNKESWSIGEFVSFELKKDEGQKKFTIILKGDIKYADLLAIKIDGIRITMKELDEYVG